MKMLEETYGKDSHYLCKAASLPNLTPATTLEMEKFNWCIRSLDEDPTGLKSIITILNYCGPPADQEDCIKCVNMHNRLSNSHGEEHVCQYVEHSKSKTMD